VRLTAEGLALIKDFEGFSPTAYRCAAGVLTIGYGHTSPGASAGGRITEEEGESLLLEDIANVEAELAPLVTREISDNAWSALVSLAFNIGIAAFRRSSVLRYLSAGDMAGAANAIEMWVKARDSETGRKVTLPGLVKRRAAEKALFLR
jgi:lysozyme